MEFLKEMYKFATDNSTLVLLGAVTMVEIVPIKINPWSLLFKWIGNALNGDLKEELTNLKKDFEDSKVGTMRWNILNFARSCRMGEDHSEEEWNYVIAQLKQYETFCEEKHIENGVIEETAIYIRQLYHKRLHKNDFL